MVKERSKTSLDVPETKNTYLRRGLTVGALATLAACSGSTTAKTPSPEPSKSLSTVPATTPVTGLKPASDFAWGPHVRLSKDTYGQWDPKHPEPLAKGGNHLQDSYPYLLVVDDARFNYPNHGPDPNADSPTYFYAAPTHNSAVATGVSDGTVLKVIGYTDNGQPTSDAHGNQLRYTTWEEVVGHDGTKAWVPWVNVGYTALSQLRQLPSVKNQHVAG